MGTDPEGRDQPTSETGPDAAPPPAEAANEVLEDEIESIRAIGEEK